MKNVALEAACGSHWRCSLLPALAAAQEFPGKTDQADRAVPGRRAQRHHCPHRSASACRSCQAAGLIDNRGGQGGVLGTDAVAKAAPDGYTIGIVIAGALAINQSMEKVAYDTLNDLAPVTLVVTVPEMLVVATNVPAKNMASWSRSPRRSPENSISPPPAPAACRILPANCSS